MQDIIESTRQLAAGAMPGVIFLNHFALRLDYLKGDAEVIVYQDDCGAPLTREDAEMLWGSSSRTLRQLEELVLADAPAALDGFRQRQDQYAAGFAELVFVAKAYVLDIGGWPGRTARRPGGRQPQRRQYRGHRGRRQHQRRRRRRHPHLRLG